MNLFDNIIKGVNYLGSGQLGSDVYDATHNNDTTIGRLGNLYENPKASTITKIGATAMAPFVSSMVTKDSFGKNTVKPSAMSQDYINPIFQGINTQAKKAQGAFQEGVSNASNFVGYRALGDKVKEKFPGAYDSIDPALLGKKTLEKHPEYQKFIDEQNNTPFMDHPIASTIGAIGKGLTLGGETASTGIEQVSSAPMQSDFATASSQFGKGIMNTALGGTQLATSFNPAGLALNTAFSTDTAGKILKPVNDIMGQGISNIQGGLGFDPNSEASKNVREMGQTAATIGALKVAHMGVNKGLEIASPYAEPLTKGSVNLVKKIPNPAGIVTEPVKAIYNQARNLIGNPNEIQGIQQAIKPNQTIKNGRTQDIVSKEIALTNSLIRESGAKPIDLSTYKDAIKTQMQNVGSEINRLTGQDLSIDLTDTAGKIREIANSPSSKLLDPSESSKLLQIADNIEKGGKVSVTDAETMNQFINDTLRSQTSGASETYKRGLQALVGDIRTKLDETISNIPGEFSQIKKTYGALRNVFGDTAKREIVYNRANPEGLISSIGKIEGAGDIVGGIFKIVTGKGGEGISQIGKGLTSYKVGQFIKERNDSNNLIKRVFEKDGKKSTLPNISNKPTNGTISTDRTNNSTNSNTNGYKGKEIKLLPSPSGKPQSANVVNVKPILVPKKSTGIIRDPRVTESKTAPSPKPLVKNGGIKFKPISLEDAITQFNDKLRKASPSQPESWYKSQLENQPFYKNPEKYGVIVSKSKPLVQVTPNSGEDILANEARKYKSAEEFIRSIEEEGFLDKNSKGYFKNIDIGDIPKKTSVSIRQQDMESIKGVNLSQKIPVLKITDGKIAITDGAHRIEASRANGVKKIPVFIQDKTASTTIQDFYNQAHGSNPKPLSNESKVIKPTSSNTIPEGYTKNAFGEIIKKPSNKNGGFIRIPEIGGKSKTAKELEGKVFYTGQKTDWTPKKLREYNPSTDDSLMYGPGLYLTPDISIAEGYARGGGKVHSIMPEIKNPLTPNMKDWLTFIQKGNGKMKQDFLIRKGYDAVVDIKGKYKQIMIVDPEQVKVSSPKKLK